MWLHCRWVSRLWVVSLPNSSTGTPQFPPRRARYLKQDCSPTVSVKPHVIYSVTCSPPGVLHSSWWTDSGGDQSVPGWERDGDRQQVAGSVYSGRNPSSPSRSPSDRGHIRHRRQRHRPCVGQGQRHRPRAAESVHTVNQSESWELCFFSPIHVLASQAKRHFKLLKIICIF